MGIDRHLSVQQDALSSLIAAHKIHAADGVEEEKISIERLELHLGHPSGVSLTLGRVHALSTVRRRRPIYLLPPSPSPIINRSAELETLRQTVIARSVADLNGPDGSGKSTLAAALVHKLDLNHFPDGAVFVKGPIRHPDLLQALFDCFYESDSPVKVTLQQTHTYLHNLRVLVVLDDVGLGPKQIDPVLDALNEAAVLILGPERIALGRGRAILLKGLPHQEAVALFRKSLGRTSAPDEALVIDPICTLLNDMPLPVTSVAAHVAHSKQTLTKLLTDLQGRKPWSGPSGDPSVGPSLEQIVLTLDATDRQILIYLAAFVAPSVSKETLRRLLKLSSSDFEERIERLKKLKLIYAVQPTQQVLARTSRGKSALRLALNSAYYQTMRTWLVDDSTRLEVANYYTTRISRGDQLPGDELPGLLGAIEDCAHNGWLDQLKPLVRAADLSLAKLRWWAEWQHLLDLARRTAQAGGDRALEAWTMHQMGSLLGAIGVYDRAFHLLETALSIRQALGDQIGVELSARNLDVLERVLPAPIPVPAEEKAPTPEASETVAEAIQQEEPSEVPAADTAQPSRRRTRLALLAASVLLLIGTLTLRFVVGIGKTEQTPDLIVSWEFGDAWNALDNETWTQQIKIITEGNDDDYRYYANGESVGEMFEVVLPLCSGTRGTIRVESDKGQSAEIEYEFDSPYCP